MLELPWAMLAKGPACTNAGVPSNVCIKFGFKASFIRTVNAPVTPKSSTVTGSFSPEKTHFFAKLMPKNPPTKTQFLARITWKKPKNVISSAKLMPKKTKFVSNLKQPKKGNFLRNFLPKSLTHVGQRIGQSQDGHNFRSDADVELGLPAETFLRFVQTDLNFS
uniref:Uncharacterized protein n=1 Tax=Romanomermis culicivorax TaxID=13658 RepID=A0A915K8N1_ROMCU